MFFIYRVYLKKHIKIYIIYAPNVGINIRPTIRTFNKYLIWAHIKGPNKYSLKKHIKGPLINIYIRPTIRTFNKYLIWAHNKGPNKYSLKN